MPLIGQYDAAVGYAEYLAREVREHPRRLGALVPAFLARQARSSGRRGPPSTGNRIRKPSED